MREIEHFSERSKAENLSARCPLCSGDAELFLEMPDKTYHRCGRCLGIFLDRAYLVSPEAEKRRYEEHNNDIHDTRYQKFVEPIVLKIQERFTREHRGLDYGAGTGPVIAKLLWDKGYPVELYDPYFWNNSAVLEVKYDFIICCEVIEHFHSPAKEFKLLRSLLNPGGELVCMTDLYSKDTDFKNWYYKNDPTHVFFYHAETLYWIKEQFGFSSSEINNRLIKFPYKKKAAI